eukprot:TRINITY_DN11214_c0_g1_i1.p1 TRINITY_DN11214_c0_g1~~TRINITY_DN11214_c0_g1_i1.p1  ORF type:complete len:197 (-),score=30.35 TRINITY_DN11214_c0_g1_i1:190-780(-)
MNKNNRKSRDFDCTFKLLLIGDCGVGKSSLMRRVTDFTSPENIDFLIHKIEVDGLKSKLHIWDTAGQEKYQTITSSYFRGAQGILLVFDISNPESFENIDNWLRETARSNPEITLRILIGNKSDLTSERMVDTTRAQEYAQKKKLQYLETSAKTGSGVDDAFNAITRLMMSKYSSNTKQPNMNYQFESVKKPFCVI